MRLLYTILAVIILTGCSPTHYSYQIISTKTLDDNLTMSYSNSDYRIDFDFWGSYGNAGFTITNLSDENIELNLDSCFFVSNGEVFNLFRSREYSSSSASTRSYGSSKTIIDDVNNSTKSVFNLTNNAKGAVTNNSAFTSSSRSGVVWKEEARLIIPTGTHRYVEEYSIVNNTFKFCNLQDDGNKRLKKGFTDHLIYNADDTPLAFSLIINHSKSNLSTTKQFEFYVYSIKNVPPKEVIQVLNVDECGNQMFADRYVFIDTPKNKFYIKYKVD